MIVLGDKRSNIRAIHYDYQIMGDQLWDRFNQNDKNEFEGIMKAFILHLENMEGYGDRDT